MPRERARWASGSRSAPSRGDLYRLVFRQGFLLMLAGLVFGLAAAAAATRWMRTLLFNTPPSDATGWVGMIVS